MKFVNYGISILIVLLLFICVYLAYKHVSNTYTSNKMQLLSMAACLVAIGFLYSFLINIQEEQIIADLEVKYQGELMSVKIDTVNEGRSSNKYYVVELKDGSILEYAKESGGNSPVFSSERRKAD